MGMRFWAHSMSTFDFVFVTFALYVDHQGQQRTLKAPQTRLGVADPNAVKQLEYRRCDAIAVAALEGHVLLKKNPGCPAEDLRGFRLDFRSSAARPGTVCCPSLSAVMMKRCSGQ